MPALTRRNLTRRSLLAVVAALSACSATGNVPPEENPEPEEEEISTTETVTTPVPLATPKDFPQDLMPIPSAYFSLCGTPGSIERLAYQTQESFSYGEPGAQILDKQAFVYLPYGYSADEPHNIVYLMHGGWSNETTLMGTDTHPTWFKNVLDNAIADGRMQPVIVVCPTYNNTSGEDSGDYALAIQLTYNYHNELVGDLMPAVEGTYRTFAQDVSPEGLAASRDHRAFMGFSMGSVTTWRTFEFCLDYFRYFAPSSGNCAAGAYWDEVVRASGHDPRDFFILAMTGTEDFAGDAHAALVKDMASYPSFILADNEQDGNILLRVKEGATHSYEYANEYFFNTLMWLWNHGEEHR